MPIFSTSLFAANEGYPNIPGWDGNTLLHTFIKAENKAQIKRVLNGVNIDIDVLNDQSNKALHFLFYKRYHKIFEKLLSCPNIDINAQNEDGFTAFHCAVIKNNYIIIDRLLSCPNIDINVQNEDGFTALHCAVIKNDYNIVDRLLSCPNIAINAQDEDGFTALHCAVIKNDYKIVDRLMRTNIDINIQDIKGFTALMRTGFVENPDKTKRGCTALHQAVSAGNIMAVNMLLKIVSNINARSEDDETALDYAIYHLVKMKKARQSLKSQMNAIACIKLFIMYQGIEDSEIKKFMFILFTMHLFKLSVLKELFACCSYKNKLHPLKNYCELYNNNKSIRISDCRERYPENAAVIFQIMFEKKRSPSKIKKSWNNVFKRNKYHSMETDY